MLLFNKICNLTILIKKKISERFEFAEDKILKCSR